jgi:integrase
VIKQERQRFITREVTSRILDKCDPTWKVIVALARYGGLRCPSEVLSLRWDGIDWEHSRITVESPKTEHHPGRARRVIPLFPELRDILGDAREIAPDGAVYVVGGNYRATANTPKGWKNCNLRTQFERIINRAGLEPWPRLFHNLRASRETELAAVHPLHVVTAWLGNTPKIAMTHYLQVTDADFERAVISTCEVGGAKSGAQAVQNEVQHAHASTRTDEQETNEAPDASRAYACVPTTCVDLPVAGTGFEPATSRL